MRDKGTLKYHGPCQACGSKDNKAVYEHDNGELSAYCFGCGDYAVEDNPIISNKKENNMSLETVKEVNDYPIRGFKDRCITKNVADKYGVKVGYSEEDGTTIQYHYYPTTRNNEVVGYSRREVSTKKFIAIGDTKNDVQLFGQSLFQQGAKKLIITEGELDAMSVQQMYANKNNEYPVVSITNGVGGAKKQIAANLDWINSFEEIIFMFDADEVGKNMKMISSKELIQSKLAAICFLAPPTPLVIETTGYSLFLFAYICWTDIASNSPSVMINFFAPC
jgi:twinkle protein